MSIKSYKAPESVPSIEYIQRDLVLGGNTTFNTVATHEGVMCITLHANQPPSGTMSVAIQVNGVARLQYNVVKPLAGHLMDTRSIHVEDGDAVSVAITIDTLGFGNLYYRMYFWFL
jgi:hypothetical protein